MKPLLTLSWRRPLSYRNKSIEKIKQCFSEKDELIRKWPYTLDLQYLTLAEGNQGKIFF